MLNKNLDAVKKFLNLFSIDKQRAIVNSTNTIFRRSVVAWAVFSRHVDILQFLLEKYGADINFDIKDCGNHTALDHAEMNKDRNPYMLECLTGFLSTRKKNIR